MTQSIVLLSILIAAIGGRSVAQPGQNLIPARDIDAVMKQFNAALGVECTHCHVQDQWKDQSKPAWATARNMWRMVAALNDGPLANTKGVRCMSCHGGQVKPSRLPTDSWTTLRDKWPPSAASSNDGVKITMSVYSASLGVDCAFCHEADRWTSSSKPAHGMAQKMAAMFDEFPKYMPAGARTQCYMCHKGQRSPK